MNWVNTMRTMFNKGQLPKEYINAILNVNPNFFEKKIKTFDESLDEYRIFYETNKRFPNVAEMNWVDTMRTMFNKGQLSRKKINTILEVNPNFFEKKKKTFEENVEEYSEFLKKNTRFPKVTEMNWVNTMRTMFNKGQLSRKKINTILEVNPNFFDKKSKTKIKERR